MELVAEAKKEFTTRIVIAFSPQIYQGIRSIYDSATLGQPDYMKYRLFQGSLSLVKRWNSLVIDKEYSRVLASFDNNEQYLEKLVEIVFISHLKILKSVCGGSTQTVLDIPNVKTFLHMCYIQAAREFYEDPMCMDPAQGQKGYKQAMRLIQHAIEQTIRQLTPLDSLLLRPATPPSARIDDAPEPETSDVPENTPIPSREETPAPSRPETTTSEEHHHGEKLSDAFLSPPPPQSPDLQVLSAEDVNEVKPEDIKHIVMNQPTTVVRFESPAKSSRTNTPSPEPFFKDE